MANMNRWYLYVLRYNTTGNYYVGATPNLESRMLTHKNSTSKTSKKLPQWSKLNQSSKGFKYYWFDIKGEEINQSTSNLRENDVTNVFTKYLKEKNFNYFVIGGDKTNSQYPEVIFLNDKVELEEEPHAKEIDLFLKEEITASKYGLGITLIDTGYK